MTQKPDHGELQAQLRGPIPSIRPPFTPQGELDVPGLRRYVEASLAIEPAAVMITYGDSHLHMLIDREVEELTSIVIDAVAGRSMVIASEGSWWTGRSVEFSQWCKEIGVDVLMSYPPDWVSSCTPDSLVTHLRAVGEAGVPLMLLTAFLRPHGTPAGVAMVEQICDQVPAVMSIKDDVGGDLGRKVSFAVHDSWSVIAGGSKQLHTQLRPYGCQSWLTTLGVYRPDLARQYRDWIDQGDDESAARFIREVDSPMYDLLIGARGSFDAALHGWLELIGIAGRWRRAPHHSATDAELEDLAVGLARLGLLEVQ